MTANPPKLIAYYTSWCQYAPRLYPITDLPVESLTHVNYAFANIVDGKISVGDVWGDLEKPFQVLDHGGKSIKLSGNYEMLNHENSPLRHRNHNLRSLISVGGWTWSKDFSLVARDSTSRDLFIDSCIEFLIKHQFDGIDIDWEYPVVMGLAGNHVHPDDGRNFSLLLQSLKRALVNAAQKLNRAEPFLLTVATSATESTFMHLDMIGLANTCDWINIMTYDNAGTWSKSTAHHSNLSFVKNAINGYIQRGVPTSQINLGIAFYARTFGNVHHNQTNPYQANRPYSGPGPGTHDETSGVMEFTQCTQNYPQLHIDPDECVAVWCDVDQKVWMSGENQTTVGMKSAFARHLGLAGIFFWEASMDPCGLLVSALLSGWYCEG